MKILHAIFFFGGFLYWCDDDLYCRRERRPVWCGVVTLSILAALFLVTYNLNEFLSSFTVTTLQSSTEDLENIYFPSVTICNRNQIRSRLFNT